MKTQEPTNQKFSQQTWASAITARRRTAGTVKSSILPILFYSTPSIYSEGACALRGSSNFYIMLVALESGSNKTSRVGYYANSLEVCFDGIKGAIIRQPILFYVFNSHVLIIVSAFAGTQSAWGSVCVWILGFHPRPGTPLIGWDGGPTRGFRWSAELTPAEPLVAFKRDVSVAWILPPKYCSSVYDSDGNQ